MLVTSQTDHEKNVLTYPVLFQLLQRGKSREQRLQDALRNIQGNAALVEELLSWLTEAQVLLATKEKDPIPEDLNVVETLAKEHTVSTANCF